MTTTRLASLLMGIVLLTSACAGAPTMSPSQEGSPVTGKTVLGRDITVPEDGQVVLSLRASAPGASWARKGAEAATVSVHVDGAYRADVVLFRGETPHTYDVLLGQMSKGSHRLEIRLEASKSATQAKDVRVDEATVRAYNAKDPLYLILAHAPILYGREDARDTDTPLFMYYETGSSAEFVTIQYTIIFSNEDGGTAADGLMARWGRLTDIEWVYRVVVDQSGKAVRAEYQDKDHGTTIFAGKTDGQQPLLRDVTKNNLFGDTGTSSYRFALAPLEALSAGSREEMMDLHPWMYQVMAEEWEREGQSQTEKTANPATRAVSDPRNYLYVEFRSAPQPGLVCDAKLAFAARLRGGDAWYSSDHGEDSLRIQNNNGWRRGAIELPPGTKADQVESLRFTVYAGKQQPPCALVVNDVRKVFMLGQDYTPGPSIITWHGEQALDADPASAHGEAFAIAVGR
jgi:hypothetical protein